MLVREGEGAVGEVAWGSEGGGVVRKQGEREGSKGQRGRAGREGGEAGPKRRWEEGAEGGAMRESAARGGREGRGRGAPRSLESLALMQLTIKVCEKSPSPPKLTSLTMK